MKYNTMAVGIASLVFLFSGCGSAAPGSDSTPTPTASTAGGAALFKAVDDTCRKHTQFLVVEGVQLADGGRTLLIDGAGKKSSGPAASDEAISCYLNGLHAPDSVIAHITHTRALDGQQTDSWDGTSARWTYHPDAGLDLVLTTM